MDRLEPCPSCSRHVRVTETRCPFCAGDVSALAALAPRAMPQTRLGRAALVAFGVTAAASAASTAGCADEPDPEIDTLDDASALKADAGNTKADAGAVSTDAGSITRFDSGTVVALYGLALPGGNAGGGQPGGGFIPDASKPIEPVDAGRDAGSDAGRTKDAGPGGGPGGDLGGAVALYGLAPAPDAGRAQDAGKDGGIIRRDAGGIVPLYGLAIPPTDESA